MNIRTHVPGDREALVGLVAEVDRDHAEAMPDRFRTTPTTEIARLSERDLEREIYVAELAGSIIGFVDVRIRRVPPTPRTLDRRIGFIKRLVVTKAHRDSGVGRALLSVAAQWVRGHECKTLELNVYEFNSSALALCESLGYVTTSRRLELLL